MAKRLNISPRILSEHIKYDPDTGLFHWRHEWEFPVSHFWHRRVGGKPAFATENADGYLCGRFKGTYILAHHAAFAIRNGTWCLQSIDHIDGNTKNNAWENLRPASVSENNRNRRQNAGRQYLGAHWNSQQSEWRAEIQVGRKKVFLGAYQSAQEAAAAFDFAAVRKSGHFARVNFPERRPEYEAYLGPIGRGRNGWMLTNYVE